MLGGNLLKKAETVLERQSPPSKESLRLAALLFWRAYFWSHKWSVELQQEADAIVARIFEFGPVRDTIDRMDGPAMLLTAAQLKDFCQRYGTALSAPSCENLSQADDNP